MSYNEQLGGGSTPSAGPGSQSRRRWFLSVSGFLLLGALWVFRDVLVPFMFAIIIAYVFSPLVKKGQQVRVRGKHLPRWVVVAGLYAVLIASLIGIMAATVPRLSAEFSRLAADAPRLAAQLRARVLPEIERRLSAATTLYRAELREVEDGDSADTVQELERQQGADGTNATESSTAVREGSPSRLVIRPQPDGGYELVLPPDGLRIEPEADSGGYVIHPQRHARQEEHREDIGAALMAAVKNAITNTEEGTITVVHTTQQIIAALARGIFSFVMMLMVSAYMLLTSDRIFDFFRSMYPPDRRGQFDDLLRRMDRGLAGVVRGQLIISVVNGVLSGIGFVILGLKYWVFLTLLATVMSVIPIFGSILSTIPAVLAALPQGLGVAALVLAWIVGIHQIEANLLNPKIMGDAARVHPVLVVFALLAGEHVAGITGAVFAVPLLSVTQTLFLYLREQYLGTPRTSIPPAMPGDSGNAPALSSPPVAPNQLSSHPAKME